MYSKEKLYELAYLGSRNKNSEFEFEDKRFNSVEKEWFTFDNEHYGASICTITEVDNARASVYVVIDNSIGNEGCDIKITRLYKEALEAYNDFENLIKSDYSRDEDLKKKQLWFQGLETYKLESSIYGAVYIAYDLNIEKFIFITFSNREDRGYSYGIYGDLTQSNNEMHGNEGEGIPYEHGFDDIVDVIKYLKDIDFYLEDWKEEGLREFALLKKINDKKLRTAN